MSARPFLSALIATVLSHGALPAQNLHTLSGRVVEDRTANPIPAASVRIESREILGTASTGPGGGFRFEDLQPGAYTLRVLAVGYAPRSRYVVVEDDVALEISLAISPLALDTLAVDARSVDIGGRVVEKGKELPVVDAEVLTDQGRAASTDAHGRFDLEGVLEDVPLLVVVRAFGYRPLPASVRPEDGERYEFELEPDPAVQEAIEAEVERIESRAVRYPSVLRSMDGERLDDLAKLTLADALRAENRDLLDRVRCVLIDERQVTSVWTADVFLHTTVPREVQRVEFLSAPDDPGFVMMRVYTREFIRRMTADEVELRRPTFVQPSTGRVEIDQRDYPTFGRPGGIVGTRDVDRPPAVCR